SVCRPLAAESQGAEHDGHAGGDVRGMLAGSMHHLGGGHVAQAKALGDVGQWTTLDRRLPENLPLFQRELPEHAVDKVPVGHRAPVTSPSNTRPTRAPGPNPPPRPANRPPPPTPRPSPPFTTPPVARYPPPRLSLVLQQTPCQISSPLYVLINS